MRRTAPEGRAAQQQARQGDPEEGIEAVAQIGDGEPRLRDGAVEEVQSGLRIAGQYDLRRDQRNQSVMGYGQRGKLPAIEMKRHFRMRIGEEEIRLIADERVEVRFDSAAVRNERGAENDSHPPLPASSASGERR